VPAKNLTPYERVPPQALVSMTKTCKESPIGSRSLDYCLLGAPNSGKSTLTNLLVDRHISAVSPKASTTWESSKAVLTDVSSKTQLLFYDTPGFTKASNSLTSKLLVTKAWDTI